MTDENNSPKRVFKQTFSGKFGVSDNPADHGFGRRPEVPDPDAKETRRERREYERSQQERERKSFGRSDDRPFKNRERKPFSDFRERRRFDGGDRKPFGRGDGERRRFEDGDRKPFERGDRERRGDRPFGNRDGKRPFNRGDRRGRGFGERRSFEDNADRMFMFRQKPERTRIEDEDVVRDEDAVLNYADSADILPETGASNPPWFRRLLALTTEKGREREGRFLAEGYRVVNEILSNHLDIVIGIYCSGKKKVDENGEAVLNSVDEEIFEPNENFLSTIDKARAANVDVHIISEDQIRRLSSTVTPQGIIAVCRAASTKPSYEKSRSILTLVDSIQDPGNLGAIFRTSLGFNSSGIVLGKGSVNPFNPKVVRGSSGTFLRVPFEKDRDLIEVVNELHRYGYTVIATDLHGKQSLAEIEPRKLRKVAFLVGNEGAGTDQHLIEISDETVKIPMSSDLESLNVAVAHGILSYEMAKIQKDIQ